MNKLAKAINKMTEIGKIEINLRKNSGGMYFNGDEYEQVLDVMAVIGAEKINELTHLHSKVYTQDFEIEGVKITAWFTKEKDKSDRIAELEKELAELRGED